MCDYLNIQKPEYFMEGHSGNEKWLARFPFEASPDQTDHASNATMISINGLQDCASLVEQKLFEKIYSGEIHLEDGCGVTSNRAAEQGRMRRSLTRRHPKAMQQRRERDEGLTLEEINQRLDSSPHNVQLPPSANFVPLGPPRLPLSQHCGPEQDTGYESEDELSPDAMILDGSENKAYGRIQSCPTDSRRFHQPMQLVAGPFGAAQEEPSRCFSEQRTLGRDGCLASKDTLNHPLSCDEWPQLLPSGEHPYVSPPPFLDTPPRLSKTRPPIAKAEPVQEDDENEEIVFIGERRVEADQDVVQPAWALEDEDEGEIT